MLSGSVTVTKMQRRKLEVSHSHVYSRGKTFAARMFHGVFYSHVQIMIQVNRVNDQETHAQSIRVLICLVLVNVLECWRISKYIHIGLFCSCHWASEQCHDYLGHCFFALIREHAID